MLNELLIVERAAINAGISLALRHPDVKDAGKRPTLDVFLDGQGHVVRVRAIPSARLEKRLWKLSRGQKNSFPFVQPKALWDTNAIRSFRQRLGKKPTEAEKRQALLDIAAKVHRRDSNLGEWTSSGMMTELRKRRKDLVALEDSDVRVLPAAIDRFLVGCDKKSGGKPAALAREIADSLIEELGRSASSDLLAVAIALFTESGEKGGALYFDAEGGFAIGLTDVRIEEPLCRHLRQVDLDRAESSGICSVTGEAGVLVSGNFSQPSLPRIQQSFLFSRNEAIPSASRYGRSSADSISVGYMTDIRLCAAIQALTSDERKNKTWRGIPGEAPKQTDLLLAFVDTIIEAPVAEAIAQEDFSDASSDDSATSSIAAFEKRTERLIDLVRAKVGNDVTQTRVRMIILRKVDQANRKVVYADTTTVADLYRAATEWTKGERNIPEGLTLPVFTRGERGPKQMSPPHVAPLGLIDFTKQIFLRSGERPPSKKKEQVGMPAGETLRFFMSSIENKNLVENPHAHRVLRLVLSRRSPLLVRVAQLQHTPRLWERRNKEMKKCDHYEALRTVTILGTTLYKIERTKEVYMNETAFKLGQLLAAADVVHAGYCADVRGGAVPPSLLGNQVFTMAQTTPTKALATLCRRWKPYDGWAKKKTSYEVPARFKDEQGKWKQETEFKGDAEKREFFKAKAITLALSQRRRVTEIAHDLKDSLPTHCDDTFRAELLLGYIAGLRKTQTGDSNTQQPNSTQED